MRCYQGPVAQTGKPSSRNCGVSSSQIEGGLAIGVEHPSVAQRVLRVPGLWVCDRHHGCGSFDANGDHQTEHIRAVGIHLGE